MKIYLLRHGECQGHEIKRFCGQIDPPLTRAGKRQAETWKASLIAIPFDSAYCSDLRRAEESARIILGGRKIACQPTPELREIDLGDWDGCAMSDIRRRFPEQWRERGRHIVSYRPPGGESFADLNRRVISFYGGIAAQAAKHVLIVAHAGVNRVILCHVLGLPLSNLFRLAQDYSALNIIHHRKKDSRLTALNLTPQSRHHREYLAKMDW